MKKRIDDYFSTPGIYRKDELAEICSVSVRKLDGLLHRYFKKNFTTLKINAIKLFLKKYDIHPNRVYHIFGYSRPSNFRRALSNNK